MPRLGPIGVNKLYRYIGNAPWEGYCETDTRENLKALAAYLRESGIPARAITLPQSKTWYGHLERYVLYLPRELTKSSDVAVKITCWEKETGLNVNY